MIEVHPHTHSHGKKNWKQYFWEFFMLFLAVTAGFFMENLREHYVEQNRAKKFAVSLIHDLKGDTAEVHLAGKMLRRVIESADTVMSELNKPRSLQNDTILQIYGADGLTHWNFFDPEMGTYDQIKNSGELRYFPQPIVNKMTSYETHKNYIAKITANDLGYFQTQLFPFCQKISNPRFLDAIKNKTIYHGNPFTTPPDVETLESLYKQAHYIKIEYLWQINIMGDHERMAIHLLQALEKRYHLN